MCCNNDLMAGGTFLSNFLFLLGLSEHLICTCPAFWIIECFSSLTMCSVIFFDSSTGVCFILIVWPQGLGEVSLVQDCGPLVFGVVTNGIRVNTEPSPRCVQLGHNGLPDILGPKILFVSGPRLMDLSLFFPTIMILTRVPLQKYEPWLLHTNIFFIVTLCIALLNILRFRVFMVMKISLCSFKLIPEFQWGCISCIQNILKSSGHSKKVI